jgi:endonuclease/exonuclease/phosphatase family metal-dependent hydrolase
MATQLRIATFNVENLFDRPKVFMEDDPADGDKIMNDIASFQKEINKTTYDKMKLLNLYKKVKDYIDLFEIRGKKLLNRTRTKVVANGREDWAGWFRFKRKKFSDQTVRNTAKVIKDVNPDVLCVVEAESRPVLHHFSTERLVWTKSGKKQRFHHDMLVDGNDARGIDVGLLSKFPVKAVWSHIDDKKGKSRIFSRDCPEYLVLVPDGRDLWVLCNHFKSKGYGGTTTSNARRKQQAEQVAKILKEYDLSTDLVIIAGDLNDTPGSSPLEPLLQVKNLFDALDLKFSNASDRWTYHFKKNEQIDYLLVSKPLADGLQDAGVFRKGMHNVEKYTASNEKSYSTVTTELNAASDHGCVWADFSV